MDDLVISNLLTGYSSCLLFQGWCSKRTQLKTLFTFTSYRERWLELSRAALVCYDGQKAEHRKEKDRILLKDVRLVETVSLVRSHKSTVGYV